MIKQKLKKYYIYIIPLRGGWVQYMYRTYMRIKELIVKVKNPFKIIPLVEFESK